MPPLPALDWAQPWLAPYRGHGETAARAVASGASVAAALQAVRPGTAAAPAFAD